jgi:hypothetical protein
MIFSSQFFWPSSAMNGSPNRTLLHRLSGFSCPISLYKVCASPMLTLSEALAELKVLQDRVSQSLVYL